MSKELTPLEVLERHRRSIDDLLDDGTILPELHYVFTKELDTIETALKALEIIKEKTDAGVVILGNTPHLRITINNRLQFFALTQEEYKLLKEILK